MIGLAVLVASGGVYLVVFSHPDEESTAESPPTGLARWSGAEANPALLAEALSTERDAGVQRALLERAAKRPGALALFRAAWDATSDNTVHERLLVEAARLGIPGVAGWLAEIAASDDKLAVRAGNALGTIVDRRAAAELVTLATGDGSTLVRANAAKALGTAGSADQLPVLSRLLNDAGQPLRVREEAALSMGNLHDPSATRDLVTALEASRDASPGGEQLRIALIRALEALGTREAREALQAYAAGKPSRTEAAFLQRALARR